MIVNLVDDALSCFRKIWSKKSSSLMSHVYVKHFTLQQRLYNDHYDCFFTEIHDSVVGVWRILNAYYSCF